MSNILVAADLRLAGVPLDVYGSLGADFWDEFVEICQAAVRAARGPDPTV
ncbi:MAG: hypothetical protein ACR2LK_05110 [Solirubrobacteraceae bacterium]